MVCGGAVGSYSHDGSEVTAGVDALNGKPGHSVAAYRALVVPQTAACYTHHTPHTHTHIHRHTHTFKHRHTDTHRETISKRCDLR